ncbi:MAG: histidine kinase dimerization/phosphoacceptor domain -containing protein [bacterium]|nr:histidine kinase dimerization/phosphoacceptor domain -containing protein [bacterium]
MDKPTPGLDPELTNAIIGTLREPIIILDQDLRVIVASRAFYDTFKVDYEGVRGKLFYELGDGEWNIPALRTLLEQIIPEKTMVEEYEVQPTFARLGMRTMLINAREVKFDNRRKNMLLAISDVTEQRETQREKERLMTQKDTLLKEMRHRIGNSLQLIASIILLKSHAVKSKESRLHLEETHDRVLSIATVQRNLDPTDGNTEVPVVAYLKILCESIAKSMIGGRKPVTLKVTGSLGAVTPDEAIGLGLVTTELVMNALKHAFPTGEGQITVTYESKGADWKLTIGDDGTGLSATEATSGGLGTSIVESLATQLNADVQRKSTSRGTVVSIIHPRTLATLA